MLCSELGHTLVETQPEYDVQLMYQRFVHLWSGGIAAGVKTIEEIIGRPVSKDDLEPLTWALAKMGDQFTAGDYLYSVEILQRISRDIARFFKEYDLWLTPTLIQPPVLLGYIVGPPDSPLQGLVRAGEFAPFTQIQNMTGQPAMSVPLYWNSEGLPIGLQFAGRFGDEATLFRVAAQLEEAQPWMKRLPPIHA